MKKETEQSFIVYLSTYPPRKCGIATFTQDLSMAVDKVSKFMSKSKIIAMNNGKCYDYSDDVIFQINDKNTQHYREAAKLINEDEKIKLVNIQHEFKIFGSDYGENLLIFLEEVMKPVITTFHSIFPAPSEKRKNIIRAIAKKSKYLIVMNELAIEILRNDYELKDSEIVVIPHGIHDVPYEPNEKLKNGLGYNDRILLTSFGFLRGGRERQSSGRGYEYVLDALPAVFKQFPEVLYLIIGITHPKYLESEGERYRNSLENKVKELKLESNVKFVNEYVSLNKLFQYLEATDIYISSSLNPQQITSGTLIYAMGCGCAVISTPFLHAKEIVTQERGLLLDDFKKPELFSNAIIQLLSNNVLRNEMMKNAYSFTRKMTWSNVALSYIDLFNRL